VRCGLWVAGQGLTVRRPPAHLELGEELASHAVLGKHATHCLLDDALRNARLKSLEALNLHRPRATSRVPAVKLVLEFLPTHQNLLGVNDDDVRAHVHGGRVGGHVATAQVRGDQRGDPSQPQPRGVNDNPRLPAAVRILTARIVGGIEDVLRWRVEGSTLRVEGGGWRVEG